MVMNITGRMNSSKLPDRPPGTKTLEYDQNIFHSYFVIQEDFHNRNHDWAEEFSQPEETAKPDIAYGDPF